MAAVAPTNPLTLAGYLTQGQYQSPAHLTRLSNVLLDVAGGRCPRLLVTMPPRHGKSQTCSHWFPTWFLGKWPDRRIILSSYEANFAASWGRRVRDSLEDARNLFRIAVRRDVRSVSEWDIAGHSGGMITAGVGGAITGRGADLLIIDDPVKNAEEALSATYREKAWDWYTSTALTRLEPGGAVVMILTRWHLDDLAGRALAQDPGQWRVINLPALAEEGDALGREVGAALWPERYPVAVLDEIKGTLGSYWWSALYQQNPITRGGFFKREWFPIMGAAPAEVVARCRFWDKAATAGGGDWTVGLLLSVTSDGLYFVEDMRRIQGSSGEVRALILQTTATDGPEVLVRMEQEPGSAGKDVIASYARDLAGYRFRGIPATGSKEVRADPVATQAETGNIRIIAAPWNQAFLDEVEAFGPGAEHDDIVDALSGAFAAANKAAKSAGRVTRVYQG